MPMAGGNEPSLELRNLGIKWVRCIHLPVPLPSYAPPKQSGVDLRSEHRRDADRLALGFVL